MEAHHRGREKFWGGGAETQAKKKGGKEAEAAPTPEE